MSWIEFNKSFSEFVKLKRNISGALLEIREGEKFPYRRRTFLIGDINTQGSAEEGGRPFSDAAIVLRYRYVFGHFEPTNRITHQDTPIPPRP